MRTVSGQLKQLFVELDQRVEALNQTRKVEGSFPLSKSKVQLLGQMSLLANERVSMILWLAQTGDMDALLSMDGIVKEELKNVLKRQGFIYDEDSHLIWTPPGTKFEALFDLKNVLVEAIDAESALVSKAVKAPEKNKQLIREAIAADEFPTLVDRILRHGGKLENFL